MVPPLRRGTGNSLSRPNGGGPGWSETLPNEGGNFHNAVRQQ